MVRAVGGLMMHMIFEERIKAYKADIPHFASGVCWPVFALGRSRSRIVHAKPIRLAASAVRVAFPYGQSRCTCSRSRSNSAASMGSLTLAGRSGCSRFFGQGDFEPPD